MKRVVRYWGYVAFAVLIAGWSTGRLEMTAVVGLSAVTLLYFLFGAPVWCGAPNRNGTLCRNNASGLLLGCRRVRYHKWLKLKLLVPRRLPEFNKTLWASPAKCLTVVANMATIVSMLVGIVALGVR